ncbi:MAG: hypothetical protein ABIE84_06740, partial [bacterium]
VAFHFDPIIYYPGWEDDYREVVAAIFEAVPAEMIAWISLGALRFPAKQKELMQKNLQTSIRFEYLEQGKDTKLRYPQALRIELFKNVYGWIRERSNDVYVYLCMENEEVWRAVGIRNHPENFYYSYFQFSTK